MPPPISVSKSLISPFLIGISEDFPVRKLFIHRYSALKFRKIIINTQVIPVVFFEIFSTTAL